MNKAGGIIALIAGIFAVLASVFTLFIGGIGVAFANDDSVASMGMIGLLFSFLVIVFGAIAMGAKTKNPGIVIIICSIIGGIAGGTIVFFCMILALIGGILALNVKKDQPQIPQQ